MAPLLLSVGVFLIAAGLAAIGFGVPYYEFGTGNALIISGSAGVVGGLIVFGLGAVVRELQRLGRLSERAGARPPRPVTPKARAARPRADRSLRDHKPPARRGGRPSNVRSRFCHPTSRRLNPSDRASPTCLPGGQRAASHPSLRRAISFRYRRPASDARHRGRSRGRARAPRLALRLRARLSRRGPRATCLIRYGRRKRRSAHGPTKESRRHLRSMPPQPMTRTKPRRPRIGGKFSRRRSPFSNPASSMEWATRSTPTVRSRRNYPKA